jgi:isocitrate dehydrogenase kinase/phosphatase
MNANAIAQTLILGFEEFKKGFINLTASGSEHFANCRWTELRAAMQQRIRLTEISIDQGASVISLTPPDNANWKLITGKFLSHFANDNWHVLAISYLNACLRQAYAENSFPLTVLLPYQLIG